MDQARIKLMFAKIPIFQISAFMLHYNTVSKSKMISRRQGGGDTGPPRRIEEADDAPGIPRHSPGFPAGLRCQQR